MKKVKKCEKCSKEFECASLKAKWCSSSCGRRFFYQNTIKKRLCVLCGSEFDGGVNKKYCSSRCVGSKRADHLRKIQQARRKYPKIEGLTRCQVFRRFNREKCRIELNKDNLKRGVLIQSLGARCVRCGYNEDLRALQLDHIIGDGKEDRNRIGSKIARYYVHHLEEAAKILQVLCANCHAIKTFENRDNMSSGVREKWGSGATSEEAETFKKMHHK